MPWYYDDPNSAQKSSINTKSLVTSSIRSSIIVAVIDSGVNTNHPSLKGKIISGYDMVSPEINPRGSRSSNHLPDASDAKCPATDTENPSSTNHGTEVASVIVGNGELDVVGINPAVKILPVRAVGPCEANYKDLIDSILWSAGIHVDGAPDNPSPAKILNISMAGGHTFCSDELQDTVNKVLAKGSYIISAAGNTFGKPAQEPSVCEGVISVGSVNPDKSLSFFSPNDPRILVYTPGGGKNIFDSITNKIRVASYKEDAIGSFEAVASDKGMGTSFSSPMVAGIAADIISRNSSITPQELITKIVQYTPADPSTGYRILNYEQLKNYITNNN